MGAFCNTLIGFGDLFNAQDPNMGSKDESQICQIAIGLFAMPTALDNSSSLFCAIHDPPESFARLQRHLANQEQFYCPSAAAPIPIH